MTTSCVRSKLADVFMAPLKTRLTFFCTVAECQAPFMTRSGSYFQNLMLTCTSLESGAAVELSVFFCRKGDALRLQRLGDVALVHNALVSEYEGERNLKLAPGREECGVAFFDLSADAEPYCRHGVVPVVGAAETRSLELEREFGMLWRSGELDFWVSEKEKRLSEVQAGEEVDVGCRVVGVDIEHDPKLLWIWDGSDVVPEVLRGDDVFSWKHFGQSFKKNCSFLEGPWASSVKKEQEELPVTGSIVPVAFVREWRLLVMPTGWIKLRRVPAMRYNKQLILLITDDARWSPVPEIGSIRAAYSKRMRESKQPVSPEAMMSTVFGHPVQQVPLREIRAFLHRASSESATSARQEFRCLVYVMECKPSPDETMEMLLNSDQSFSVNLLLQDATDRVYATLQGRHGQKFLCMSHFEDDHEKKMERATHIQTCLTKAIMENDPVPWFDVCLRAIYKDGISAVQVVDTVLR